MNNSVNHPEHYGGKTNTYEAIKVIRAWNLNFNLGNTIKYIARAGKKDETKLIEDLEKALWYLKDEIEHLKKVKSNQSDSYTRIVEKFSKEKGLF